MTNPTPDYLLSVNKETADRLEVARALTGALLPIFPELRELNKAFSFMQGSPEETRESLTNALHPLLLELVDEFGSTKIPLATFLGKALAAMPQEQTKAVWSTAYVNDLPPATRAGVEEAETLFRIFLAKAIGASLDHIFARDTSLIKKAMMVRTEHDDILRGVASAIFASDNVTDIVVRFLPTAEGATIQKFFSHSTAKGSGARIPTFRWSSAGDFGGVTKMSASIRAILRHGPDAREVVKGLSAEHTSSGLPSTEITSGVDLLVGHLASCIAKHSNFQFVRPTTDNILSALTALFHDHTLLKSDVSIQQKAVWSTAYINDLEDTAFLYIAPGGEKDPEGKTTPRSNRYFPYRDVDGAVDLPHLRNAIARIPQANIPDGLKPALQERARTILDRESAKQASAEKTEKALLFGPRAEGQTLVITDNGVTSIGCEVAWSIKDLYHPLMMLAAAYPESLAIRALAATLMGVEPEETAEALRRCAIRALGELLPLTADLGDKLPELNLLLQAARPELEAIATMTIPDDMFEGMEEEGEAEEMEMGSRAVAQRHQGYKVHAMARMKMRHRNMKADMSTGNLAADGGLKNPSQGGAMLPNPGKDKRKKSDLPPASIVSYFDKANPTPFAAQPEAKPAPANTTTPQPPASIANAAPAGDKKDPKLPFPGAAPAFKFIGTAPVTLMLEASPPEILGLLALVQVLQGMGEHVEAQLLDNQRLSVELAYQKTLATLKAAAPTESGVVPSTEATSTTKEGSAPALNNIARAAYEKAFGSPAPATKGEEVTKPADDPYAGMSPLVTHVLKKHIPVYKAAEERYVFGVVLEPETIDAQNDIISAETIRNACHKFMEEFQNLGLQHKFLVNGAVKILESFVAPVDFKAGDQTIRKGSWVLAVRVLDDKLWKMVKDGDLTGFSIGGMAYRTPEVGERAAA